jgi:hypothetical protein
MNLKQLPKIYILAFFITFLSLACGPINIIREAFLPTATSGSEEHTSTNWYVALDGDDTNTCFFPDDACKTIYSAIERAGEGDTIFISEGTYFPNNPRMLGVGIHLDKSIILHGEGRDRTFIDGNTDKLVLSLGIRIEVSVLDLTIQNGGTGEGGTIGRGIEVPDGSSLSLRRVSVRNNQGVDEAGGIKTFGTLDLFDVIVIDNQAISNPFSGSSGANCGGILNNGLLTAENVQIIHNQAPDLGGGICNWDTGTMELINVTIFNNQARRGGGIHNAGTLRIEKSTIYENSIYGIYNSVSDNTIELLNVTISGNTGAGIANASEMEMNFTTIAFNTIGIIGINLNESIVRNSIIAGNIEADCSGYPTGVTTDNMTSDDTCARGVITDSILINTGAPYLGILQDNGGTTFTHALLPSSPAIDAVTGECLAVDQRGEPRPDGDGCDLGAFEGIDFSVVDPAILDITGTPVIIAITPTSVNQNPKTNKLTLCRIGPGPIYDTVSAIEKGLAVELVGIGQISGWFVINNPTYIGFPCWIPAEDIDLPDLLPDLPIISIPATPPFTVSPTNPLVPDPTSTPCANC